jgi:hypothetical protein
MEDRGMSYRSRVKHRAEKPKRRHLNDIPETEPAIPDNDPGVTPARARPASPVRGAKPEAGAKPGPGPEKPVEAKPGESGNDDYMFRDLDVPPGEMKSNEGLEYGIVSVYFPGNPASVRYHTSSDAFDKCYKIFRKSVRANTKAILHIIRPEISELKTDMGGVKGVWFSNNELKARKWTEAAQKIKRPTVFMDIDTAVLQDLADGFQGEMTITRRGHTMSWFNSGVVFVQPTQAVKDFFLAWYDRVLWFYKHPDVLYSMKKTVHTGIHQLSFITLLKEGKVPLDVKVIDANVWNASRSCWQNFSSETKVIHATAEMRREAFEKPEPTKNHAAVNAYKKWLGGNP